MAIKIIRKGEWEFEAIPEAVRTASPLLDPGELLDVEVAMVNQREPYVVIMREPPNHYSSVHYHTSSEAMIVLDGRMMLNGEWCEPGAIIYIEKGEEYWHSTGDEGCVAALIRPQGKAELVPGADSRAIITQSAGG